VAKAPSPATDKFINAIAVHEGNANVIWVGHNNGEVYRTLNGLAATPTWTRVGQGTLPARRVQRITIDRDNSSRAIVAFTGSRRATSGRRPMGRDLGLDHRQPAGGAGLRREAPPARADWLYAATSVGVFTSENGGASWSTTNEGPANIRVRELFWIDEHTLGAATYGRGMYRIAVATGGPANYQDLWWAGSQENGWGMSITQHGTTLFIALFIYDAQGNPLWVVMPGGAGTRFHLVHGPLYIPTALVRRLRPSRFVSGAPVGRATLTFTSAHGARSTYTINGVSGTKSISRQPFGPSDPRRSPPTATSGGAATRRTAGVSRSTSSTARSFSVWYTYDSAGRTSGT
jgi:hypothetical protein